MPCSGQSRTSCCCRPWRRGLQLMLADSGDLAPYSAFAAHSRGRRHAEPLAGDAHRIPARPRPHRPQHRVSAARIQDAGVRQPRGRSVPHAADALSRGGADRARALRATCALNEDLVEAVALAHDLGHTPFGHAGQDALHECMRPYGGFEHNLQSLRVVDVARGTLWRIRRAQPDVRNPRRHPQALLARQCAQSRRARRTASLQERQPADRGADRQSGRRDRVQQPRCRRRPAIRTAELEQLEAVPLFARHAGRRASTVPAISVAAA